MIIIIIYTNISYFIIEIIKKTFFIYSIYSKMLIERKQEVLNTLEKNYVMVRDEDGELLCLLGRDDEWYFIYSLEQHNITKSDAEALLDKAAWIALTPVVDEKIKLQYQDKRDEAEESLQSQIDDEYFEEE